MSPLLDLCLLTKPPRLLNILRSKRPCDRSLPSLLLNQNQQSGLRRLSTVLYNVHRAGSYGPWWLKKARQLYTGNNANGRNQAIRLGSCNAAKMIVRHDENRQDGGKRTYDIASSLNLLGLSMMPTGLQTAEVKYNVLLAAAMEPLFGLLMAQWWRIVCVGGTAYAIWYKGNVIRKMKKAFKPRYEPALLDRRSKARERELQHPHREQQSLVDQIISGERTGQYWMLLGPKGAGKSTMVLDAMSKFDAEGLAYVEAHPDLEVFRSRIGEALNFKFNEDSQALSFKRKDPREGGPALDIERALSKLERVAMALSRSRKRNKPLVFVFNNVHHFKHSDEGRNILLQLQQRAETWADNRIMTVVFVSDDFWPYAVLNKNACAGLMQSITVNDLNRRESIHFAHHFLQRNRRTPISSLSEEKEQILREALAITGGRLSFVRKLCSDPAKSPESLLKDAKHILKREKAWLLSRIGLIPRLEGQVTNEQILSVKSWDLLCKLVEKYDKRIASLSPKERAEKESFELPSLPFNEVREIMTRSESIYELDHDNIIAIDVDHNIRPDSNLVLLAAREVIRETAFGERLKEAKNQMVETMKKARIHCDN